MAAGVWGVAGSMLWAAPSVKPVGVSVVWEERKDDFDGFSTMNQQHPVKVAVLIDMDGLGIIDLDDAASKITKLTDDAGKDLDGEIWTFPSISKDGKLMRLEINGKKAPTSGSKSLSAKGALVVMTGSKTEVKRSELVPAEKGATVKVSEKLSFEISKAGKPQWGDDPFMVELEVKRDIPEVAEVLFYDDQGELIESDEGGASRMGFFKKVTVQKSYNLKRKVKSFRVEVKVWTDMKEVEVPFDLTFGIGGAK